MKESFKNEELVIHIENSEHEVTVRWEGASDTRDPSGALAPLLKKIIEVCKDKSAVIDLRALRYMNSATIAPLIGLMKSLDGGQSRSVFIWNSKIGWQRANFLCMKTIARTLTQVAVESRDLPPRGPLPVT